MKKLFEGIGRRDLRLGSGLVLFTYLSVHLVNHALGLISFDVAEAGLRLVVAFWHSALGTVLLYGAAATHIALALFTVYERRTLRMPALQLLRTLLGLWMPVVLITHFIGTRLAFDHYDLAPNYARIVPALWTPRAQGWQLALLVPGWIHGCLGLKFAFGGKKWYVRMLPVLFGASLLLPVLAGLGFLAMGREMAHAQALMSPALVVPHLDNKGLQLRLVRDSALALYVGIIALSLIARHLRWVVERQRKALVTITYPGRQVQVPRHWTVLEASRSFGIPHLSLCGGNARCSTCRVRIDSGAEHCSPPSAAEQQLLSRMGADEDVRLACQLRAHGDISVEPLFEAASPAGSLVEKPQQIVERTAAILVADFRRSGTSVSSHRSAHDMAYALNLFHDAFGDAVLSTGGTPCSYAGHEAIAIFGLKGELQRACQQTLEAMALIEDTVHKLNARLATDISALGTLVLVAHTGSVVFGPMGHRDAKALTAVGLAVDVARRLRDQAQREGFGCVISQALIQCADEPARPKTWIDAGLDQDEAPLRICTGISSSGCLGSGGDS